MKPIVRINEEENIIEFLDERWYPRNDKFYVSITHVLGASFPKGAQYEQWLKDLGANAKFVAERAAESGNKVHHGMELLGSGIKAEWDDKKLDEAEWKGLIAGHDFLETFVESIESSEGKVYNDKEEYAGRIDLVAIISGERWLLDYKFSNGVYDSHYLQLAAYRRAWDLMYPDKLIDNMGVVWLRARTRGRDKSEKVTQGKGWQLLDPKNNSTYKELSKYYDKDVYELLYDQFLRTLGTWRFLNPRAEPKNIIYPMNLQIDKFIKSEKK